MVYIVYKYNRKRLHCQYGLSGLPQQEGFIGKIAIYELESLGNPTKLDLTVDKVLAIDYNKYVVFL